MCRPVCRRLPPSTARPRFNVSVPALLNAVFLCKDGNDSASWSPYPNLAEGIRNRLVEAVGRLPREWLRPPQDGETFDTFEEGQ
jgi:hypothetical protein